MAPEARGVVSPHGHKPRFAPQSPRKFAASGFAIDPGMPKALAQRNPRETARWAQSIKDAKIELRWAIECAGGPW
jgi:hypothetical protein